MGRQTARSAALTCPRCAALIVVGSTRCGICHLDLTAPAPAPVVDEPAVEVAQPVTEATEPAEVPDTELEVGETAPIALADGEAETAVPAPHVAEPVDRTTPLTLPADLVATEPAEPVAVEPVAVEPVAVEPVAVEPVAVEPVAVPQPEPAAPAATTAPEEAAFIPGGAVAPPAYAGAAVKTTKGVRQALTIVVIIGAVLAALSQVFLWFAARQVSRTFEQVFSADSTATFDPEAAQATLQGGAFAASLAGLAALGWILLSVAAIVLFLVWQAQANANARALSGRTPRFGTAPALICWFVPIANLVIPWLNLNDMWNTTAGTPATRRTGRGTNLVIAWWVAVAGQAVLAIVNGVPSRTVELDASPIGPLALAQTALYIASVVLMLMTVRTIGSSQESGHNASAPAHVPPPSPFDPVPAPTPSGAPAGGRVLVSPSTAAPLNAPQTTAPNQRINPRDPFSWGASQPPTPNGPTFP